MKILVADKFPDAGRARLETLGLALTYEPGAKADALPSLIGDHEILLVRGTEVRGDVLRAGKALTLVIRAGAGVNTIDVSTASRLGVFVANCPGKNAIAVAELALGLLVALDRRIPQASADLHRGRWEKGEYAKADGLFGRTLGVLGLGTIGREVVSRARAIGMQVVAWSRSLDQAKAQELGVEMMRDPLALAERASAVSVHLAYSKDTVGLVGQSFLERLPPRAMLVNTSRGGVVDEQALLAAITERGLRYATDVFAGEPEGASAEFTHALAQHPQVIATPHIGASTGQAQDAVADAAVSIVEAFVRSGEVPNCVNLCAQSPARWQLNVRHLDQVGVLAGVLGALREAGINVEEVENVIFEGAEAACARIRLDSEPAADLLSRVMKSEHVLDARLITIR